MKKTGITMDTDDLHAIEVLIREGQTEQAQQKCTKLAVEKYQLPPLNDEHDYYGCTSKGEFLEPTPPGHINADEAFFRTRHSSVGRWIFGG